MSKTAIWFFGSNKLNSSNVVQITQRIVTWMMTNRFVHSKPENNVIEHHNPPWMGHCRWCSSLMAIFDAENKWNLVVWVNHFSFVCCQPAAGARREAPRRARREATTTRATSSASSTSVLLQLTTRSFATCTTILKNTYIIDNWIIFWVPVLCSAYKLGFLFSPLLPFP